MAPITRSRAARPPSPQSFQDYIPPLVILEVPHSNDNDDLYNTTPPVYTIDLSLPPAQRYAVVAKDYLLIVQVRPELYFASRRVN